MADKIQSLEEITNQKGYLQYSKDVIHPYSKAAGKLIDLVMNHFELAFEEGKKGKQVIWNNCKCTPLVYACDTIPLTIPDISRFGHSETIPKAEAYFQIPAETCAMIKAILGGFYEFKDSPCKRIASTGIRCEPELEGIAVAEKYGYETYILDIAKKPNDSSPERHERLHAMYKSEYEKYARWLNGKELDKEKLREELIRANRIRDILEELDQLERKHNTYFKTVPTMLARCGAETYFGQPELYESILLEMIDELKALKEGEYLNNNLVKIVWSGARGVDFSVYNAVDVLGGYVAEWNLPTSIDVRYDIEGDPLDSLVSYDLADGSASKVEVVCQKDIELVEKSQANGIVLYTTLGCTFLSVAQEMKRRYLSEKDIPVLVLTGTSQIGEATGQVMTRLKAFMEMIA